MRLTAHAWRCVCPGGAAAAAADAACALRAAHEHSPRVRVRVRVRTRPCAPQARPHTCLAPCLGPRHSPVRRAGARRPHRPPLLPRPARSEPPQHAWVQACCGCAAWLQAAGLRQPRAVPRGGACRTGGRIGPAQRSPAWLGAAAQAAQDMAPSAASCKLQVLSCTADTALRPKPCTNARQHGACLPRVPSPGSLRAALRRLPALHRAPECPQQQQAPCAREGGAQWCSPGPMGA